jgi:Site-specific DNA methylase
MRYLSVCSGIEAATCAWHPMGWQPVGFSEIEKFPAAVLAHHYPDVPNFGDMTKFEEWPDDIAPDVLVGGTPCQSFSVAGLRKGLDDPRGNLMLTLVQLLAAIGPSGWFGRTSPASCHLTADGILEPSSGCWQNSGMGSPTEFLTLSTSEWPSDAAVCSLSDTLETGDVPQRFFLSATACRGILRRAAKRGKSLPSALHEALLNASTQKPKP